MKKVIVLVFACLMLTACGAAESGTESSTNAGTSVGAESTQTVKAGELMAELESYGVVQSGSEEISEGTMYTSDFTSVGGCMFNYSIISTDNGDLYSAEFYIEGNDTEGILAFCAAYGFEGADKETATDFVTKNINTEFSTASGPRETVLTIGNTVLSIVVDGESTTLYVMPYVENT
ncbi:hypothetical protein LJC49_09240 [Ruminococcaceae bacterium OttesenSCG-928-I18]|nr:hypothetical protein [Ruminococcaceae bacterium OttesenSCG-928-I18]